MNAPMTLAGTFVAYKTLYYSTNADFLPVIFANISTNDDKSRRSESAILR